MSYRFLYLLFTVITLSVHATSASAQNYQLSNLVDYYSQLPGQYIKPNNDQIDKFLGSDFYLNQGNIYTPAGEKMYEFEFTQDLFYLDVNQFIQTMNATDFLDAKVKFYSKLFFNYKTQLNEAPYHYLSGWLSLNHPPIKKIVLPLGNYTKMFSETSFRSDVSTYFSPAFQNKLDQETGTELTFGNKLTTLFNGNSIKEKTRLVNDAKHYVFGAVMAMVCDPSSEEFVQALINKAQSGIPVTIIMEHFYMGIIFKNCTNRLRNGGVDIVLVDDKLKLRSLFTFFHAKFWVRDGEEVIVGGQNIVEYENNSTGFNQLNRDTDLLIQGPATTDFVSEYLSIWEEHARKRNQSLESYKLEVQKAKEAQRIAHTRGADFYEERLGNQSTRMLGVCRTLVQGPYNRNLSIAQVLRHHIEESQHSIILTSPSLEFDLHKKRFNERNQLISALRASANRGVNTELILNGVEGGDGEFTEAFRKMMVNAFESGRNFSYHFWKTLLGRSPEKVAQEQRKYLREFQTTPGMRAWTHFNYMHAKQAYFDRIVTSISSVNLDTASLERNYEAGALCMDENLSQQMEVQLTLDLVNSVPVTTDEVVLSLRDPE